jgi:hypothetical protein
MDPVTGAEELVGKIIDVFSKHGADKAALEQASQSGELQLLLSQIATNREEAKSTNWFIAGWRPFVGWVCGFALLYVAILDPIARFVATVILKYVGPFPVIDTTITMQVLFGLLGLGGMRMIEKIKGAEGNR